MELLFKNTAEVKSMAGWLYASTSFDALRPDLEIATEDVCSIISQDVYDRAVNFYKNGQVPGSGSGSGDPEIDSQLVQLIQMPVALLAILSFVENSDLSHESDGRKVKINKEEESLPWEWMIERDNAAILKKANRGIDRLIAFLDSKSLAEWTNSDQRKDIKSLFVPDAATFDSLVPIDKSRVFYIRTLAFNRKEDKNIRGFLLETYDSLKILLKNGEKLTDEQQKMLDLCQEIVVYGTMAKAVRFFSVKVLPDSVVQRFDSSSQTQKSSQPAKDVVINSIVKFFSDEKASSEKALSSLLNKKSGVTPAPIIKDYSNDNFFSA